MAVGHLAKHKQRFSEFWVAEDPAIDPAAVDEPQYWGGHSPPSTFDDFIKMMAKDSVALPVAGLDMAAGRLGSIRAGRMRRHGSQEPTGGDLSASRCPLPLFVGAPDAVAHAALFFGRTVDGLRSAGSAWPTTGGPLLLLGSGLTKV